MKWITTQDVQSGDIIETRSKIPMHSPAFRGAMVPFIKHYGMICHIDGKQHIVHNIIGRSPTVTPCDQVFTNRRIERVLRTGMTDEGILQKFNECKTRKYRIFSWNCESLMVYISGNSIGFPQRDGWSVGIFTLLLIIILILIFGQKK